MKRECSGFTVIELMTVIVIVAVLATLSISNFISLRPRYMLGEAVTDILSMLQNARLRAVKENRRVVVLFDPDGNGRLEGEYIAFVDNGSGGAAEWTRQAEAGEPAAGDDDDPVGAVAPRERQHALFVLAAHLQRQVLGTPQQRIVFTAHLQRTPRDPELGTSVGGIGDPVS